MRPDPSQTLNLGERFPFLQSRASGVLLAPIFAFLDFWSELCICSLKMWVPFLQFWIRTHDKRFILQNDVDPPRRELLACCWCRPSICSARRKTVALRRRRGGQAPLSCDTNPDLLCNAHLVCAVVESCVVGTGG